MEYWAADTHIRGVNKWINLLTSFIIPPLCPLLFLEILSGLSLFVSIPASALNSKCSKWECLLFFFMHPPPNRNAILSDIKVIISMITSSIQSFLLCLQTFAKNKLCSKTVQFSMKNKLESIILILLVFFSDKQLSFKTLYLIPTGHFGTDCLVFILLDIY